MAAAVRRGRKNHGNRVCGERAAADSLPHRSRAVLHPRQSTGWRPWIGSRRCGRGGRRSSDGAHHRTELHLLHVDDRSVHRRAGVRVRDRFVRSAGAISGVERNACRAERADALSDGAGSGRHDLRAGCDAPMEDVRGVRRTGLRDRRRMVHGLALHQPSSCADRDVAGMAAAADGWSAGSACREGSARRCEPHQRRLALSFVRRDRGDSRARVLRHATRAGRDVLGRASRGAGIDGRTGEFRIGASARVALRQSPQPSLRLCRRAFTRGRRHSRDAAGALCGLRARHSLDWARCDRSVPSSDAKRPRLDRGRSRARAVASRSRGCCDVADNERAGSVGVHDEPVSLDELPRRFGKNATDAGAVAD